MKNKLKSNKGSTLTIAIIIMIVLTSVSLITVLIMGRSTKTSINRVNKKHDTVILENTMYDTLNYLTYNSSELIDQTIYFNNNDGNIEIVTENYKYTVELKNLTTEFLLTLTYKGLTLSANVTFDLENKTYKVLKWSL